MKKYILILLAAIATTLFVYPPPETAVARITDAEKAELGILGNKVKNSGFESNKIGWEATGSSAFSIDAISPLEGSKSALWNPSAAGEYLRSATAVQLDASTKGRTCELSGVYQWPSGVSGEIVLEVLDQSNSLLAGLSLEPSTDVKPMLLNFSCPDPATTQVKWALRSTADAAEIKVDGSFADLARNGLQVSQTAVVVSAYYQATAGCAWAADSTSYIDFGVDNDCPAITVDSADLVEVNTADDGLPNLVLNNVPAARYLVRAMFSGNHSNGASVQTSYQIRDDQGNSSIAECANGQQNTTEVDIVTCEGVVTYASAGSVTFTMQGLEAAAVAGGTQLLNDSSGRNLRWTVIKYPTNSAEAITLETLGQNKWSGRFEEDCFWQRGSTVLGEFTGDATCTLSTRISGLSVSAEQDGTGSQPGIVWTSPVSALYKICAITNLSGTSNTVGNIRFGSASQEIYSQAQRWQPNTASPGHTMPMCGFFQAAAGVENTINIQTRSDSGSITLSGQPTGGNFGSAIEWHIFQVDQSLPIPVFTEINNKLNARESGLITVSAYVTNSGTPTVTTEYGNWVDSLVDAGTGDTTFNTSVFSQPPVCNCTAEETVNGTLNCNLRFPPTSSAIRVQVTNGAGSGIDRNFMIECTGK